MLLDVYAYLAFFFFVGSYKAINYIYTVTYRRPSSFYGPNVPLHSHFSVSHFPVPSLPFHALFFFRIFGYYYYYYYCYQIYKGQYTLFLFQDQTR